MNSCVRAAANDALIVDLFLQINNNMVIYFHKLIMIIIIIITIIIIIPMSLAGLGASRRADR